MKRRAAVKFNWRITKNTTLRRTAWKRAYATYCEISRSAQKSRKDGVNLTPQQKTMKLQLLEQEMKQAAAELDFERAALLRDEMIALKQGKPVEKSKGKKTGYKGRKKGK